MTDAIHHYLSTERNPAFCLMWRPSKTDTCSSILYAFVFVYGCFEEITLRKVNEMVHVYDKAAWIESRSGTAVVPVVRNSTLRTDGTMR